MYSPTVPHVWLLKGGTPGPGGGGMMFMRFLPLLATWVAACPAFRLTGKGSGTLSNSFFTGSGALGAGAPPPPPMLLVMLEMVKPPTARARPTTPRAPASEWVFGLHGIVGVGYRSRFVTGYRSQVMGGRLQVAGYRLNGAGYRSRS